MSYPERTPGSRGALNHSITGTNPFLGGDNPPAYQPVGDSARRSAAPAWQPNQYYRGPAQAPPMAPPGYAAPQPPPGYAAPQAPPDYAAGHYGSGPYRPPDATNTLAQIALVAAFPASIVGVVLGHIALSQIKQRGETGRGLAIAALAVGYAQIVSFVGFVVLVTLLAGQSS